MSPFPIKLQFFLTYGVLGSIGPLMALILQRAKGLDTRQAHLAFAISSLGMLVSPALMTYLADRDVDSRKILRFLLAAAAAALAAVFFLQAVAAVIAAWVCYSILFAPTLPLLDGYYFNYERRHGGAASADGGYQFVRVWGTIGFLLASIALAAVIWGTGGVGSALWCGVAWCGFAYLGTYRLAPCPVAQAGRTRVPTFDAIRVLFSRKVAPMCAGLFLVYVAANAYYANMSVLLESEVGIAAGWIAPIMGLGVAIEVGYLFGLGPIRRLLRIRGILLVGLGTMALRLAALAYFPTIATALLIQVLHGMEILAMFVVPVIYLDRVAGDSFRNSIQGAFIIALTVPARVTGYLVAGEISAHWGTKAVFYFAATSAAAAMLVILAFFKPVPAATPGAAQGST